MPNLPTTIYTSKLFGIYVDHVRQGGSVFSMPTQHTLRLSEVRRSGRRATQHCTGVFRRRNGSVYSYSAVRATNIYRWLVRGGLEDPPCPFATTRSILMPRETPTVWTECTLPHRTFYVDERNTPFSVAVLVHEPAYVAEPPKRGW